MNVCICPYERKCDSAQRTFQLDSINVVPFERLMCMVVITHHFGVTRDIALRYSGTLPHNKSYVPTGY